MSCRPLFLCLLSLIACGALPAAHAASPREELLRLVPEEAGFCLVISNLRDYAATFARSPFVEQLRASPMGRAITLNAEVRKLGAAEKFLADHLGVTWAQLRDDILGDAVVFAYLPNPPGQTDQDQGLMLLRARDPRLLERLVTRINQIQEAAGELRQLEAREHNGRKYFRRAKAEGKGPDEFLFVQGPVLAFSTQEGLLRRALDLDRTAPAADTRRPFVAEQLRLLVPETALASLWLNPRAFDAELQAKARAAVGAEAVFLKTFLTYWKALEGGAVYAAADRDLELGVSLRARPEALPPAARRWLTATEQPSALWQQIPPDAMLAFAGRIDPAAFFEVLGEFLSDDTRKAARAALDQGAGALLGREVVSEVLPLLGPDVGFYVTAPDARAKGWTPQAVWALRVQPGSKEPPLDRSLLTALNSFALLAVLDHNSKNADKLALKSVVHDKVEVRYFVQDRLFPPGFQPAFAMKDGYLVLASSPEAIRRFGPTAGGAFSSGEFPLLRISFQALRGYLKERREPLLDYVVEKKQLTREEAARRLDGLLAGLQLFDRLELTQRTSAGQVTLALRARPAQPFRK